METVAKYEAASTHATKSQEDERQRRISDADDVDDVSIMSSRSEKAPTNRSFNEDSTLDSTAGTVGPDDSARQDSVVSDSGNAALISEGLNAAASGEHSASVRQMVPDQEDGEPGGQKNRFLQNYASKDSGAVMLESSPGSKGMGNLLVDSKDKYAISPCEDKQWAVLGLSEDILVRTVKISSHEKYSSLVKDFQVLASPTYPVNEWLDLGVFTANFTQGEQTFSLPQPAFVRYLKFKFLSHYGNEFYCTLSQIKVHGSTMLESFQHEWQQSSAEVLQVQDIVMKDKAAVVGNSVGKEPGNVVHVQNRDLGASGLDAPSSVDPTEAAGRHPMGLPVSMDSTIEHRPHAAFAATVPPASVRASENTPVAIIGSAGSTGVGSVIGDARMVQSDTSGPSMPCAAAGIPCRNDAESDATIGRDTADCREDDCPPSDANFPSHEADLLNLHPDQKGGIDSDYDGTTGSVGRADTKDDGNDAPGDDVLDESPPRGRKSSGGERDEGVHHHGRSGMSEQSEMNGGFDGENTHEEGNMGGGEQGARGSSQTNGTSIASGPQVAEEAKDNIPHKGMAHSAMEGMPKAVHVADSTTQGDDLDAGPGLAAIDVQSSNINGKKSGTQGIARDGSNEGTAKAGDGDDRDDSFEAVGDVSSDRPANEGGQVQTGKFATDAKDVHPTETADDIRQDVRRPAKRQDEGSVASRGQLGDHDLDSTTHVFGPNESRQKDAGPRPDSPTDTVDIPLQHGNTAEKTHRTPTMPPHQFQSNDEVNDADLQDGRSGEHARALSDGDEQHDTHADVGSGSFHVLSQNKEDHTGPRAEEPSQSTSSSDAARLSRALGDASEEALPDVADNHMADMGVMAAAQAAAACLERLTFPEFRDEVMTRTQQMQQAQQGSSGGVAIAGQYETIFKTLMNKIKTLEINQSLFSLYIDDMHGCYQDVIAKILLEQAHTRASLSTLEVASGQLFESAHMMQSGDQWPAFQSLQMKVIEVENRMLLSSMAWFTSLLCFAMMLSNCFYKTCRFLSGKNRRGRQPSNPGDRVASDEDRSALDTYMFANGHTATSESLSNGPILNGHIPNGRARPDESNQDGRRGDHPLEYQGGIDNNAKDVTTGRLSSVFHTKHRQCVT